MTHEWINKENPQSLQRELWENSLLNQDCNIKWKKCIQWKIHLKLQTWNWWWQCKKQNRKTLQHKKSSCHARKHMTQLTSVELSPQVTAKTSQYNKGLQSFLKWILLLQGLMAAKMGEKSFSFKFFKFKIVIIRVQLHWGPCDILSLYKESKLQWLLMWHCL